MQPFLLHRCLTATAERLPDSVAVVDGERVLTYREFDEITSRAAHALVDVAGVQRGERVAVHADKSIEALVAIFAVMKAGGAYVPLDPAAPAERTAYIVRDCGIRTIASASATARSCRLLLDEGTPIEHVVALDVDDPTAYEITQRSVSLITAAALTDRPVTTPAIEVIDDDLAYLLYTSGSTGSPKGVMVSHRNALAFAAWAADEFELGTHDRVAQLAPLIFDLSTFDLFASVLVGASIHLVSRTVAMFPRRFHSFLDDHEISVLYAVPSMLTMLVEHGGLSVGALGHVRLVMFAGEVFPSRHLRRLMELVPHAEYANLYGPTETNVCTFHRVTEAPAAGDPPVPIGRAIANDAALVVGADGTPVAPGEIGELYIRGATVMQGYWADPERTAAVLLPAPGVDGPREPCYRTGDLVREQADGSLVFLGRRDSQVKRLGYRIELGDIEAAILDHPAVVECAVSGIPDDQSGTRLVAHVVATEGLDRRELVRFCERRIPKYMIPDDIRFLDRLPKTATDKIDRATLQRDSMGEDET